MGVLKVLHDFGAKTNIKDNKGYTCAHVAAQYGQTEFLYFMKMKCNVDVVQVLDNDLRSTLHWACYQVRCLPLLSPPTLPPSFGV